jgi:hypothetical protein
MEETPWEKGIISPDPQVVVEVEIIELTNNTSWTTRRGHAKGPPERDTKLQKMRRS